MAPERLIGVLDDKELSEAITEIMVDARAPAAEIAPPRPQPCYQLRPLCRPTSDN